MTDNVSIKECESDEERTEGPPPAKKLKQKTLQFRCSTDTATTTSAESHAREERTALSLNESCTSECCKGDLTPYQPTESSKLQVLQRQH